MVDLGGRVPAGTGVSYGFVHRTEHDTATSWQAADEIRPIPAELRRVPEVLLSGHHAAIAAWRRAEAERITRERRPDLWATYRASASVATATQSP